MSELKPELPPFEAVTTFDRHTVNQAFQQLYNLVWSIYRETGLVEPDTGGTPASSATLSSFRATLSGSFYPASYTTLQPVDLWTQDYGDSAFTLSSGQDLVINAAGRYFLAYHTRILADTPYSATYFQTALYHTPIASGTPDLIDGMSVNTEIDGAVIARGTGAAQSTILALAVGDIIDLRCRDGVITYTHHLETNGTTLLAIKLSPDTDPSSSWMASSWVFDVYKTTILLTIVNHQTDSAGWVFDLRQVVSQAIVINLLDVSTGWVFDLRQTVSQAIIVNLLDTSTGWVFDLRQTVSQSTIVNLLDDSTGWVFNTGNT